MSTTNRLALSVALLAAFSTPSYAFLDGLTSVTNNLIDSTESVTNNTVNNATTTVLSLSSNPGKMADRFGQMADRIGYMGDRIVTTEGLMSGLAHKIIDGPNKQPQQAPQQQFAWGYPVAPTVTPVGYQNSGYGYGYNQPMPKPNVSANPYMPGYVAAAAPGYGYAKPSNERYSASNMIFGHSGATYTAQRQPPQPAPYGYQMGYQQPSYPASGYGFAPQPAVTTSSNNCGYAYGVAINCR